MKNVVTFDDLYLVPGYSQIETRHSIDLTPNVATYNKHLFSNPLIASCMDTVVNAEVATIMRQSGSTAVLHRYMSIEDQCKEFKKIPTQYANGVFCAVGATGDYFERFEALYDAGCKFFCVDVAHGHHENVAVAIKKMRGSFRDDIQIMAGNVADIDGYEFLVDNGASFVRVGVAGGGVCTTRTTTGFGMPTLESVIRCAKSNRNAVIIADGGFSGSGDIVKALACGADMVMLGGMLAGHQESPGEIVNNGDRHFKKFRGMASESAQKDWRGWVSVAEGKEILVPLKEQPLAQTVDTILRGVKSGFSYAGCTNIRDFQANVNKQFV